MLVRSYRQLVAAGLVLAVIGGALLGFLRPDRPEGAGAWALVVAAVLFGFGGLVRRALRIEIGIAEQMVLGGAAWIAASGVLLAAGIASRFVLLGLAVVGAVVAAIEIWKRSFDEGPRLPARDRAMNALLWLTLAGFMLLNLLATTGERGNPYDDQNAYLALVKRVLDCGDLAEPYSFRRLSAYGGQTLLQALAALRGDVATLGLLDRGIFQWIAIALLLDLCRRRHLHVGLQVIVVVFLLSLWDLNLNSAAIWTGFALFAGAYSFATRDDIEPRAALIIVFFLCGAICTLRQNYLAPAGLFAILIAVFHLRTRARDLGSWGTAWRADRGTLLLAVAATCVVLLPYMIATFREVGTFLYPVLLGTANPALPLKPTAGTFLDELGFFGDVAFSSEPIKIWLVLVPMMLFAVDTRSRRPWPAYLLACAAGFVFLVHSFQLSDTYNLWRYAFAYLTPLATLFAIETAPYLPFGSEDSTALKVPKIVALVVWIALVAHFVGTRTWLTHRFQSAVQNLEASVDLGSMKYDPRVDSIPELQRAIPEGESVAVMLDDPWGLDFGRNRIVNLDLPGSAGPGEQLPSFTTPEHWRAYFRQNGIRYLAYVQEGQSTWLYRRPGWVWRIFGDDELYRFLAAHMVDAIDTFAQLETTSKVLARIDGMVVIDLGEAVPAEPDRGADELTRMDDWVRRFSETELKSKAWQLTSRRDVVFRDSVVGPSQIVDLPGLDPLGPPPRGLWALLFGDSEHGAFRWLSDRTVVRLHGDGTPRRLHMKVWIRKRRMATSPTVTLLVDGRRIAKGQTDANDNVIFDEAITCDGWCNAYIVISTVSEWWLKAEVVRVAKLLELDWAPAP